jgi:glycosyltransferase involved in cell wall biosynthesis
MPERPLRVCLPIAKYPPQFSGMGIQIRRSLPYLRARGIEVTILTNRLPRSAEAPPDDGAQRVDRILSPGRNPLAILRRVAQFRRYFAQRKGWFDILHCNMLAWEFMLNTSYLQTLGLPTIVEMVLLGGDDPFTVSEERFGAFKMGLLRHVDLWIGISQTFLPPLLRAGLSADMFRLVYTGVDLETYRPFTSEERRAQRARLGLPPEARIVVSVGSVIWRKGFDRLLETWARLAPRAGRDLLVVVGPASEAEGLGAEDQDFARSLQERSNAPDLSGTVRWVGRADDVQDYLCASDLFLFLSRQEGLGIVILEAMACGLPSVVSPLDGIADEIIADGRTGVIVRNPDNPGAVAASVRSLLDQPLAREAMGVLARKSAVERFSFDARADALAAIYRSLLTRGAKADSAVANVK